ncbi:MAG TPA: glutathione S-transferase N-terminal domain-containing protein [Solirubrobacteraceae bacterium]|nr:glutathione S-transferase N-terminal domain-containing protein [Solirubrobacteraceae bacterium]
MKLYMFPGSSAVLTARLMLDHKNIDYKLVRLVPGIHAFAMLALGFESMSVPAITFDGRRVQGTRSISRALDELVPERPLFPSDPERRKAVEDAERWGEDFQNATRRIYYCVARRDRNAFLSVMLDDRALGMRILLRMSARPIIRLASGAHHATEDAAREDVQAVPQRLDQIDRWIGQGVLGGPQLNAADFQIAVNVSVLLMSEDLAPLVHGRPAEALARRVAPNYNGHLGRVLPAKWLPTYPGS